MFELPQRVIPQRPFAATARLLLVHLFVATQALLLASVCGHSLLH